MGSKPVRAWAIKGPRGLDRRTLAATKAAAIAAKQEQDAELFGSTKLVFGWSMYQARGYRAVRVTVAEDTEEKPS